MKDIKLIGIKLTNFRAQTRELVFSDTTRIYGPNGCGKSTILDAFLWLIYGMDSENRFNYDLFDYNRELTVENSIPAEVEATLLVDGAEMTLKKVARQKWSRPRNSVEYVKDKSDEYKFYIDGLEVNATGYKNFIFDYFGPTDKLPLMLNIRYYLTEEWKKLRTLFSGLVDEVVESDFKQDYTPIKDLLTKFGSSRAREFVRQQLLPLKKQEEELRADIKAAYESLPDLTAVDEAEKEIASLKDSILELDKQIMGICNANEPYVKIREQEEAAIRQKRKQYHDAALKWDADQKQKAREAVHMLRKKQLDNDQIQQQNDYLGRRRDVIRRQMTTTQTNIDFAFEKLTELRNNNSSNRQRIFEPICPHCGGTLPKHLIPAEKARFEQEVAAEGEKIQAKGIAMRKQYDNLVAELDNLRVSLESLVEKPLIDLTPYKQAVEDANAQIIPFDKTEVAMKLQSEIEEMKANLTEVPEIDTKDLESARVEALNKIQALSLTIGLKKIHANITANIEYLEGQKRANAEMMAAWEGKLMALVEREREWASIVRERVNNHLKFCKVEMCEFSKSGELSDTCSISVDGVDVGVTNTANKVLTGIDIAQAFMARYNVSLPIFIDNAEQITSDNMPNISGQVIQMSVDESVDHLTVA